MSAVGCNNHLISFNYPNASHLSFPGPDMSFLNCTGQKKWYAFFYSSVTLSHSQCFCFLGNTNLYI